MGKKPDLTSDGQEVELTTEQIETARIAHCEILNNSIIDLQKKENDAKARLADIQKEIDVQYRAREEAVKNIEILASDNYRKSKAALDSASGVHSKADDLMKKNENDRSSFLVETTRVEGVLSDRKNQLDQKERELNALKRNLDQRLKNIEARETSLHGEG